MPQSGIYVIENSITGDVYVGSTCTFQKRIRRHFRELRQGTHHSTYLQRAFDKYGESAFTAHLAEEVPEKSHLIAREQLWIEALKPAYNMNPLATNSLGMKVSEETKQRLLGYSLARTTEERRLEQLGKKRSEETRRNQSEAAKRRRKPTEEERQNLSEAAKNRKYTDEGRQKRSETMKVRWAKKELTEEERAKLSESSRKGWENKTEEERQAFSEKARNRPPISEQTRRRMSEAAKNRGKRQSS